MHYLIEKLNGSLYLYEKTHSLRIYSNLNRATTTFGFSYYPRFWDSSSMPSLAWTVSKLKNMINLDQSLDHNLDHKLDNLNSIPKSKINKETVIVIGGVHWLSKKHITKIHNLVQNYPRTRLILKSLGKISLLKLQI